MRSLQGRWRVVVAALVLAALPVAAVSASPLSQAVEGAVSLADRVASHVGDWMARLVPEWATAAAETAPPEAPAGIALDDEQEHSVGCTSPFCTEGETLPDFDPNG